MHSIFKVYRTIFSAVHVMIERVILKASAYISSFEVLFASLSQKAVTFQLQLIDCIILPKFAGYPETQIHIYA